jgi:hypothetical protein
LVSKKLAIPEKQTLTSTSRPKEPKTQSKRSCCGLRKRGTHNKEKQKEKTTAKPVKQAKQPTTKQTSR